MQLAVLFACVLFFVSGCTGVLGVIGLFEKEINKKRGVERRSRRERR